MFSIQGFFFSIIIFRGGMAYRVAWKFCGFLFLRIDLDPQKLVPAE